ncbi:nucleotide exchange factor GrpE [Nocardia colli]|uniref:Protein GrpE n=1 Tax=Nocardia colli TaxID=2545717 RepID=A0A5N0EIR1_9NOCA|nr:nucleotide exchange factor GrpE [Nocardia colli]KAA8888529.1 nucleotide exchange factor GrpE [Nocardia colli]
METSADQSFTDTPDPDAVVEQPEAQISEWEDRARRTAADLDNLRKRYARDLERERAAERWKVAGAWLPMLDNLELALAHANEEADPLVAGVRAIRDQAVQVLEQLGYPRHSEVGVPFSPHMHEVVSVVDRPDLPPGTVVEVLRPGYGENGQQLRPATVIVSRREG